VFLVKSTRTYVHTHRSMNTGVAGTARACERFVRDKAVETDLVEVGCLCGCACGCVQAELGVWACLILIFAFAFFVGKKDVCVCGVLMCACVRWPYESDKTEVRLVLPPPLLPFHLSLTSTPTHPHITTNHNNRSCLASTTRTSTPSLPKQLSS